MPYSLSPGISFCHVGDRLLFLDVGQDRYFCLSSVGERSFRHLISDTLLADDQRALDRLADQGLLRRSGDGPPQPCPDAPVLAGSLLESDLPKAPIRLIAGAAVRLVSVSLVLRIRGFAHLLDRVTESKRLASGQGTPPALSVVCVAAAFDQLAIHTATHDRCLVRSVAIARRLIRIGARPDLVIGVKLQPFKAHCWVQQDGWLVNDRLDVIRPFTPILIL